MRAVPCGAMDETPAQQVDGTAEQAVEEPSNARGSRAGWVWATVVVLAAAGLLAYCSIRANSSDPVRAVSCAEWATKSSADRADQARDMLTALRETDGLGAPEAAMVERFAAGITNVCMADPGWKLSEVAAGLYVTERGAFG